MLSISILIWTTLDVRQRRNFQRQVLQRWATLKQRCEFDHLKKIIKSTSSQEHKSIFWVSNKSKLNWIGWTLNLLHLIRQFEKCKEDLQSRKNSLNIANMLYHKTVFEPFHYFGKYQLAFNLTKGLAQF